MSGCHAPECLHRCRVGLKNEIEALAQDVKKNWEVEYKRGEAFGKRLIALEKQPARTNEEVAHIAQCLHEFMDRVNYRLNILEVTVEDMCRNTFKKEPCQPCKGVGKVVAPDLSPNAQGEGDRWIAVDCPGCKGKKFV